MRCQLERGALRHPTPSRWGVSHLWAKTRRECCVLGGRFCWRKQPAWGSVSGTGRWGESHLRPETRWECCVLGEGLRWPKQSSREDCFGHRNPSPNTQHSHRVSGRRCDSPQRPVPETLPQAGCFRQQNLPPNTQHSRRVLAHRCDTPQRLGVGCRNAPRSSWQRIPYNSLQSSFRKLDWREL